MVAQAPIQTGSRPGSSPASVQRADEPPYRALFESAPGLFVVLDPAEYRVIAVSNEYIAMTRRTR